MKKNVFILFGLFLFLVQVLNGQNKVAERINLLVKEGKSFYRINDLFGNFKIDENLRNVYSLNSEIEFLTINNSVLEIINTIDSSYIEVTVPYNNKTIELQLFKVELFSKKFQLDTQKLTNLPFEKGIHYRGIVKGNVNSVVSFSFFKGDCGGIISTKELGNIVIGKANFKEGEIDLYTIYNDSILPQEHRFKCDGVMVPKNKTGFFQPKKAIMTEKCLGIYFEIDYDGFLQNNSSIEDTMQWLTIIFNAVQTIYFNDNINVAISSVQLWTEQDPYLGTTTDDYLNQFVAERPIFSGDLGQLLCFESFTMGGVAFLNGLCNSSQKYSFYRPRLNYASFPLYSFNIHAITHEIGHNLGSPHTQACFWNGNFTAIDGCVALEGDCGFAPVPLEGGTIMSYCHLNPVGVNFALGFGEQPRDLMINEINNSLCLSTDCENYCFENIVNFEVVFSNENTALLQWEVSNNQSTDLLIHPLNSPTEDWITNISAPYQINGLESNTHYKATLRSTCSNGYSWVRETIFVTSADFCSGILITDSGGVNENYQDNENITRVIIPTGENSVARINFNFFDLEEGWDFIYVYNGDSVEAEEITGGLTGSILPTSIESTAPNGSLTIQFVSDDVFTAPGYEATIECNALGNIDQSLLLDITYYPNPSKDKIFIKANSNITKVEVYDVKGAFINKAEFNNNIIELDISMYQNATYFAKIYFISNNEYTLKFIKN